MGHIANLMLDASVDVVAPVYLPPLVPSPKTISDYTKSTDSKNGDGLEPQTTEAHVWRMHQSNKNTSSMSHHHSLKDILIKSRDEHRFDEATMNSPHSSMFHTKIFSLDRERPVSTLSAALKMKIKEPILTRRRKISVPDIGPMTTVQELAMDSPTIPGRPPIHERSHSVPVGTSRQKLRENTISFLSGPAPDEKAELVELSTTNIEEHEVLQTPTNQTLAKIVDNSPAPSPHTITTPAINTEQGNLVQQPNRHPLFQQKSPKVTDPQPPEVPPKESKTLQESFSASKNLPFIPISSWSSAISATFSVSSPIISSTPEGRSSPKPRSFGRSSPKSWSIISRSPPKVSPQHKSEPSPSPSILSLNLHSQKSETSLLLEENKARSIRSHARHSSEDNTGLKSDARGRPKQRSEVNVIENQTKKSPSYAASIQSSEIYNSDLTNSPCSFQEPQSFLSLPTGHSPSSALQNFSLTELSCLQNQALSQAYRFQVLSSRDVASLSRELRALDDRCEVLQKTHHSLRNERQSIHARLISNLRNSRVSRPSWEIILKLENSLSEVDRCIDSSMSKFEVLDNRRMCVRQKLLEHVAAAAVLEVRTPRDYKLPSNMRINSDAVGENTPPRSPQQSPERSELLIKTLPSHFEPLPSPIPEPLLLLTPRPYDSCFDMSEESSEDSSGQSSPTEEENFPSLDQPYQDSYVYSDKDVFALMDFVEEEMERMGM